MPRILIACATREGHTHTIAEHVAGSLRARGFETEVVDAARLPPTFTLHGYDGAVLAASVHLGKHEREMIELVKRHRADLERLPTAFLSVSLTETTVEDTNAPDDTRAKAAIDVKRMTDALSTDTSRDHDYTDWKALDGFVASFSEALASREAPRSAASASRLT